MFSPQESVRGRGLRATGDAAPHRTTVARATRVAATDQDREGSGNVTLPIISFRNYYSYS